MFKNTLCKGFTITFANGFKASVQWGVGDKCANEHPISASDALSMDTGAGEQRIQREAGSRGSPNAQLEFYNPKNELMSFNWRTNCLTFGDEFSANVSPDTVARALYFVSKLPL